ncbi:unnamed protein product [Arctogadus glacialis]
MQSVRYSEEEEDTNPVPVCVAPDEEEEEEEEHPSRGPAWIMSEALGARDGRRGAGGRLEVRGCSRARVACGDEGEEPPLSLPVGPRSRRLPLRRAVGMSR